MVDEDIALAQIVRQPAQLLHGDHELVDLLGVAMAGERPDRRPTDDAIRLQTLFLLEGLDQRDELRRILRRPGIARKNHGVPGLEFIRSFDLDRSEDVGEFRIALAGLQQSVGRDRQTVASLAVGTQPGKLGSQSLELHIVRIARAQISGDIGAQPQHVEERLEIDRLALEVMVAGDLVRIDPASHRVGDIGEQLCRQGHLEPGEIAGKLVRIGRIGCLRRLRERIVFRREPDISGPCKPIHCLPRPIGDARVGYPDERLAFLVIGLDGRGNFIRCTHTGFAEKAPQLRCRSRRVGVGSRNRDQTCRLGLVGIVAGTGDPGQRLGVAHLQPASSLRLKDRP